MQTGGGADPPPGARPLRVLPGCPREGLAASLAPWQRWLTRRLRALSFAPVGANDDGQKADFGGVLEHPRDGAGRSTRSAPDISRVERDLLWARDRGLAVPSYVVKAMREAVALHEARRLQVDTK